MAEYRYPYGYSGSPQGMGTMLTWGQMMTKETVYRLHPEVLRRFHAMISDGASRGVPLGVGTGWRVQPSPPPPGFAQPGNSWHESCPVSPVSPTAVAIDTVPDISWDWMESVAATFGFQTFRYVNNEPWHIQPIEYPRSRSYATVLPPLDTFPLPGDDDMPLTDDEIDKIAKKVWSYVIHYAKQKPGGGETDSAEPASAVLSAAASYAGRASQ